ncbi:hypothetical protein D9M69_727820 [compost metagenome]
MRRVAMAIGHFAGVGFGVFQPARKTGQVAPVCGQGIGRQAVLEPYGVDESVDIGLRGEWRAGVGHDGGFYGSALAHARGGRLEPGLEELQRL